MVCLPSEQYGVSPINRARGAENKCLGPLDAEQTFWGYGMLTNSLESERIGGMICLPSEQNSGSIQR